ncbi:hypothetical protein BB560_002743 [Smittium megazygosporum]|uniref:Protein EFR3 n=1 Tax=Smittium megazygosporum TaxID=133381 RepID=A0A2T9ZDX4_9FUNG|nr:hypothetical protein BB560_002743 [Smittium megazygosporum]
MEKAEASQPPPTPNPYLQSFEYSYSQFDTFIINSPFRHYIKHVHIIEKCYPPSKSTEDKPLSNELSYLTYYTKSKPVKLAKVGKYIYNRVNSDLKAGRSKDVHISIQIFRALLESNSKDIFYFGQPLLLSISSILSSDKVDLIKEASKLTCDFCLFHNGSTAIIPTEYRSQYNSVIKSFISLLQNDGKSSDRLRYRVFGFTVLYSVLSCQDTYSTENIKELNYLVFAFFGVLWECYKNKTLPNVTAYTKDQIPVPILISDVEDYTSLANADSVDQRSENFKSSPEHKAFYSNAITVEESKDSFQQLSNLSLSEIDADPDNVQTLFARSCWVILQILVSNSFSLNFRWVLRALFRFMDSVNGSWVHPLFPSAILNFIFFHVSSQYQNIIIYEILLYLEKSFHGSSSFLNSDPKKYGSTSFKESTPKDDSELIPIRHCLILILGNLISCVSGYISISTLEILSKLVLCLKIASLDNTKSASRKGSSEMVIKEKLESHDSENLPFSSDLSYSFTPYNTHDFSISFVSYSKQLESSNLLEALVKTIGSLSKTQNYSSQPSDTIAFISSSLDDQYLCRFLLDSTSNGKYESIAPANGLGLVSPFASDIKESLSNVRSSKIYTQTIWLLKSIRESLANFIYYSKIDFPEPPSSDMSRFNSPERKFLTSSTDPSPSPFNYENLESSKSFEVLSTTGVILWSSLRLAATLLKSVDPQIRILCGQILILALQYDKGVISNSSKKTFKSRNKSTNMRKNSSRRSSAISESLDVEIPAIDLSYSIETSISNIKSLSPKPESASKFPNLSQSPLLEANSIVRKLSNGVIGTLENDLFLRAQYNNILSDSDFLFVLSEVLKLLLTPVTPNTRCNFLIANNFLTIFIMNNHPTSQLLILRIIGKIYSRLLSVYVTIRPFLSQYTASKKVLTSTKGLFDNENVDTPGSNPNQNESGVQNSVIQDSDKSTLFENECTMFMHSFCFVSTIYGHILRAYIESLPTSYSSDESILQMDEKYLATSKNVTDLTNTVLNTIEDQKSHNFWISEMDLFIFNPLVSWLSKEELFEIPSNIGTRWDPDSILLYAKSALGKSSLSLSSPTQFAATLSVPNPTPGSMSNPIFSRNSGISSISEFEIRNEIIYKEFVNGINDHLFSSYPNILSRISITIKSSDSNDMPIVNTGLLSDESALPFELADFNHDTRSNLSFLEPRKGVLSSANEPVSSLDSNYLRSQLNSVTASSLALSQKGLSPSRLNDGTVFSDHYSRSYHGSSIDVSSRDLVTGLATSNAAGTNFSKSSLCLDIIGKDISPMEQARFEKELEIGLKPMSGLKNLSSSETMTSWKSEIGANELKIALSHGIAKVKNSLLASSESNKPRQGYTKLANETSPNASNFLARNNTHSRNGSAVSKGQKSNTHSSNIYRFDNNEKTEKVASAMTNLDLDELNKDVPTISSQPVPKTDPSTSRVLVEDGLASANQLKPSDSNSKRKSMGNLKFEYHNDALRSHQILKSVASSDGTIVRVDTLFEMLKI